MSLAIHLGCEELRSLAFGSISGTYAGVGTSISNPARIFFVQNLTDVTCTFSFNGVTDHFVLAASGFLLLDVTSNKTVSQGFYIAEGSRLYVKGSPSSGSVYLTVFYGTEG